MALSFPNQSRHYDEAMHAIRKGQVRWVAKGDPMAQRQFIRSIFGFAA